MSGSEWALATFTLMSQASVGMWMISHSLKGSEKAAARPGPILRAFTGVQEQIRLTAFTILIAGMGLSLFHLGRPMRAARALGNLAGSWLSREILFALISAAFMGLFLVLTAGRAPRAGRALASLGAAGAGGILILVMARLYMLPAMPVWNSAVTPLSFMGTTLLLGALGSAFFVAARTKDRRNARGILAKLGGVALALIPLQIMLSLWLVRSASSTDSALAVWGDAFRAARLFQLAGLRTLFGLLAAGLLIHSLVRLRRGTGRAGPRRAEWAVILIAALAAEIAGRWLFYAAFTRIGI